MRKVYIPLVVLLLSIPACTTTLPTASLEDSYLMHVECRNDVGIRQSVLSLLRQARARDIKEDNSTGILVIEAAYYRSETPVDLLERIGDDLRRMGMVTDVRLEENHSVIRQAP
ncbi:MAG TPA: hypothetical protein VKQ52_21175 [Puia sp.]|nr:hypothetical protein [Puia sp.]